MWQISSLNIFVATIRFWKLSTNLHFFLRFLLVEIKLVSLQLGHFTWQSHHRCEGKIDFLISFSFLFISFSDIYFSFLVWEKLKRDLLDAVTEPNSIVAYSLLIFYLFYPILPTNTLSFHMKRDEESFKRNSENLSLFQKSVHYVLQREYILQNTSSSFVVFKS